MEQLVRRLLIYMYIILLCQVNVVHNQPYDESVEVSDGEEIASTSATPRGPPLTQGQ